MHRRFSITMLVFSLLTATALVSGMRCQAAGRNLIPTEQDYSFVTLESMEAVFHPANRILQVKGSIKNISSIILRGYISLHILSSAGAVLYSTEMPVKQHQPIMTGESVPFDTVLNVSGVYGASQISVDFTWD